MEGARARTRPGIQHVVPDRRERLGVRVHQLVVVPGLLRVVHVRVAVREALARIVPVVAALVAGEEQAAAHARADVHGARPVLGAPVQRLPRAVRSPERDVMAVLVGQRVLDRDAAHGLAGHVHARLVDRVAGDHLGVAAAQPDDLRRGPDVHAQVAQLGPVHPRGEEVHELLIGQRVHRVGGGRLHGDLVAVRRRVVARVGACGSCRAHRPVLGLEHREPGARERGARRERARLRHVALVRGRAGRERD